MAKQTAQIKRKTKIFYFNSEMEFHFKLIKAIESDKF